MNPPLIDISDAIAQINANDVAEASDVTFKVMQASAAVMTHLKLDEFPEDWIEDEDASPVTYIVPYDIQAATLLLFGELWENREASNYQASENWKKLLVGHRDPSMA